MKVSFLLSNRKDEAKEDNLPELMSLFPNVKQYYHKYWFKKKGYDWCDFRYLLQKGVFPYEHIVSSEIFDQEVLPDIDAFRSRLKDADITTEQYEQAQRIWSKFECKNMGDYHDLYLRLDCLLLADIFEDWRNISLQHYGLDPAGFLTAPSLSWNAGFKRTGVCLDLMTEIEMINFIDKGMSYVIILRKTDFLF